MKLILFDIDGTLVLTGGAGVRAMSRAFEDVFAVRDAFRHIPMAGRTDTGILSDAIVANAVPHDAVALTQFRDVYFAHLSSELDVPGPRKGVMPGVRPLLELLSARNDVYLALLTGNYETSARAKLEYFDLWRYFRCGAFGDDAPDRNALLPRALATVRSREGRVIPPGETVVIGDTPLDVACAAASGARSIAVATGSFDVAALRSAGADVVLESLAEAGEVLAALQLEAL